MIFRRIFANPSMRNGALFTIFSFLSSGINFILLIIVAKFIDPEGYGYINLFNTIVTLLGFLICINTSGIISVNYFIQSFDDFKKTFKAVSNITVACTFFFILFLIVFHEIIERYTGLPFLILLYAIIISLSNAYIQNLLNVWRIEEKVKVYGFYSVSFASLNFILTVLFVAVLNQNWNGQIRALLASSSLFLLLSVVILLKKHLLLDVTPKRENYKDCLKFGVPLIPHNVSIWMRQGLDRMFINNFLSIGQVGLFGLSLNLSNIIIIIASAFNNSISVDIFKKLSSNSCDVKKKLRKQTIYLLVMFLLISAGICLFSSVIVPIIFPKYIDCIPYMIPLCISAFLQCVYLQFVNFLFYFKKTRILMCITFLTSCLHVALSFMLTRYSIYYTLWISVLSQSIITGLVFYYSRKVYKIF